MIVASGNVDDDPAYDMWIISSVERPKAGAGVAFHGVSDRRDAHSIPWLSCFALGFQGTHRFWSREMNLFAFPFSFWRFGTSEPRNIPEESEPPRVLSTARGH